MIQAVDYRRRAEDCAQRASEAQDDYHRNNFQRLADMWSEMAKKSEGREAFTQDEVNAALATIQGAEIR